MHATVKSDRPVWFLAFLERFLANPTGVALILIIGRIKAVKTAVNCLAEELIASGLDHLAKLSIFFGRVRRNFERACGRDQDVDLSPVKRQPKSLGPAPRKGRNRRHKKRR